ncbi:hypothetical protein Tco_0667157, partial [Tanacetum coccineum]
AFDSSRKVKDEARSWQEYSITNLCDLLLLCDVIDATAKTIDLEAAWVPGQYAHNNFSHPNNFRKVLHSVVARMHDPGLPVRVDSVFALRSFVKACKGYYPTSFGAHQQDDMVIDMTGGVDSVGLGENAKGGSISPKDVGVPAGNRNEKNADCTLQIVRDHNDSCGSSTLPSTASDHSMPIILNNSLQQVLHIYWYKLNNKEHKAEEELLPTFPNTHTADTFAADICSLMEHEGYTIQGDYLQAKPVSVVQVPEKEFIEAYKELPRLRTKVNNFRKNMYVGNNAEDDFVAIRPEYTMVHRLLACRQDDYDEKEYLVKCVGLIYDEC